MTSVSVMSRCQTLKQSEVSVLHSKQQLQSSNFIDDKHNKLVALIYHPSQNN